MEKTPTSDGAASSAAAPAFDFQPLQKSNVDLFAPAPQVKKLTRREKQKLMRDLEVKRATESASTPAGKKGKANQKKEGKDTTVAEVVRAAAAAAASSSAAGEGGAAHGNNSGKASKIFATVFDTQEIEHELAAQEERRSRKRSKKQVLRHALHPNEEEDARTVFVGNLPNTIDKREVEKIFKTCGSIESVRVRCQTLEELDEKHQNLGRAVRVLRGQVKKDEKYSATAYVLFRSAESIAPALDKNGLVFHNRHLVVTTMDVESRAYPPETSIFIGNVAYDTTEEHIWNFFQEHGVPDVKRVRLIRDRETGTCKGFGYVEFLHAASVPAAVATRGNKLNGRDLRIVHVNKSKDVKAVTASRRDKRRNDRGAGGSNSNSSGSDRKRGRGGEEHGAAAKKPRGDSDMPSWAGVMTNPRRKMPKDLRPLVEGKTEFKSRGPRVEVKRKVRNPEK